MIGCLFRLVIGVLAGIFVLLFLGALARFLGGRARSGRVGGGTSPRDATPGPAKKGFGFEDEDVLDVSSQEVGESQEEAQKNGP